jgi:hypothetical protein
MSLLPSAGGEGYSASKTVKHCILRRRSLAKLQKMYNLRVIFGEKPGSKKHLSFRSTLLYTMQTPQVYSAATHFYRAEFSACWERNLFDNMIIFLFRSKAAPDISSEIYFPSLSSDVTDAGPRGAWGKKL